jgi:co-chaperonin GroES (HSP10)
MRLQGKAVLILPDNNPEKTISGVFIPLSAKEKPLIGTVIDCGIGCEAVTVGDRVHYLRKGASIIHIDDVEHHFVTEHQINAIYG